MIRRNAAILCLTFAFKMTLSAQEIVYPFLDPELALEKRINNLVHPRHDGVLTWVLLQVFKEYLPLDKPYI